MSQLNELQAIWNNADCICFDVDSTVITEEGIDELAKFCKKSDEVEKLTKQAMSGAMTFQESLKMRLNIIQPTQAQIKEFLRMNNPTLTPGIKELIELIQNKNIPVYLISGGFKAIITPIAESLNIPLSNIYANRLMFYYSGNYAGFDENEPTSRSGGKAAVINLLKSKYGYQNIILIGDGYTDFEASPPADAFIGFGGNIIRENVKSKAKWYITNFDVLIGMSKNIAHI